MQVREVSESVSKPSVPEVLQQALKSVTPDVLSKLLRKYAELYQLSADELQAAVRGADAGSLIRLAAQSGSPCEVVNLAAAECGESYQRWHKVIEAAMYLGFSTMAYQWVMQVLTYPKGIGRRTGRAELVVLATRILHKSRGETSAFTLEERAILDEVIADQSLIDTGRGLEGRERAQIAYILGRKDLVVEMVKGSLLKEAGMDTSDFGEDDDRGERLFRIYEEGVAMVPEASAIFAKTAVEALEAKGRTFMTAKLAQKLGMKEKAHELFTKVRNTLLKPGNDISWKMSRLGDCAFGLGEYSAAFGYYLADGTGNETGMFNAAWECDRPRALVIAQAMVAAATSSDFVHQRVVLIAKKAELPEAQNLYERHLQFLEEQGCWRRALGLAELFEDQAHIAQYTTLIQAENSLR